MADYFTQHMPVEDWNFMARSDIFCALAAGKKVLHIGCVDAPIFDAANSLHLKLEAVADELHGYDLADYSQLAEHTQSLLLDSFPSDKHYDLVLAPEVMEHVSDVGAFLRQLDSLSFHHLVITVPDAFSCANRDHWRVGGNHTIEIVHPDHVAWYSPYTLKNAIHKNTKWNIEKLFYLNHISVGAVCTK